MSYVPESVKVLTVCPECWCFIHEDDARAWSPHEPGCSRPEPVPYVPQAELDRLRAVGEELARVVAEGADQLDAIDYGERILYSPGVVRDDLASALKSYREAVPEQLRRADDGDASEQMEGGP